MTAELQDLAQSAETRRCLYNGCSTPLGDEQLFRHCETCRKLKAANAIRFVLDPESPLLTSKEYAVQEQTLLTEMTGDEILRYMQVLEDQYLAVCKIIKLRGITAGNKKPVARTASEFVNDVRGAHTGDALRDKEIKKAIVQSKIKAKALTGYEKLAKQLGCTVDMARAWMTKDADVDEGF